MARIAICTWAALTLTSSVASAHIQLDYPTARTTSLKTGPCGAAGSTRGDQVTTFQAGEVITIVWRETVDHPGHYRVAFDADGQDDFVDPTSFTDTYTNDTVLIDDIADKEGGTYTQELTIPDSACDHCTLQVIQVMTDKAPYGDDNDLYYQCADIVILKDSTEPDAGADVGTQEDTNNTNGSSNNGTNVSSNHDTTANNTATAGIDNTNGTNEPSNSSETSLVASGDSCSATGTDGTSMLGLLIFGLFSWIRRR